MDFGILRARCTFILPFPRRHHSSKTCRRCEDKRSSRGGYPDDGALTNVAGNKPGNNKKRPVLRLGNRHGREEACGARFIRTKNNAVAAAFLMAATNRAFARAKDSHGVSRNRRPSIARGAVGTWAFLVAAVQQSGFPGPANDRQDPSRRLGHWHCALQQQDVGIHQHVGGIHLISRRAPLRPGPVVPFPVGF